jgi:anti-sigma factor RsiW
MPEGNSKAADGPALWEWARSSTLEALAAEAPNIDAADLAAYLDGGLDAVACARVEAALASHADCLELLIAAREALAAGPAAAPERLVARARALASERRPPVSSWTGRLTAALGVLLEPSRGLGLAGLAAGFLMVSVAGFELGRAEVVYSSQVDSLLTQEFVGLIDRDGEDLL